MIRLQMDCFAKGTKTLEIFETHYLEMMGFLLNFWGFFFESSLVHLFLN